MSITSEIESNGEVEIQGSIALLFAVLMAGLMVAEPLLHKCTPRERQLDPFASGSSLSLRPRSDRILITLLA